MIAFKSTVQLWIKDSVNQLGEKWSRDYAELKKSVMETADKKYAEAVDSIRKDILAKLTEDVNRLSESLSKARTIIERDNNHLNQTIDEMDAAIKQLRQAHVESNLKLAEAINALAAKKSRKPKKKK